MPRLQVGDWIESVINWLREHVAWLFDFVSTVVSGMYDGLHWLLSGPNPLIMAGILAIIAFWTRGLLAGVVAFLGMCLIDAVDQWDEAMMSLSLVLVASVIALAVAIPSGVWAARKGAASTFIRPILDFMQTMPAFVYLIPAIFFFGVGTVPGVIATIIFAMPVGVRMTELGIRQVDEELVEAAEAFGTPPGATLRKVQLPLALPTIMAGVNQVIMLALSMVVISGMVGAEGLGTTVFNGISQVNVPLGFEGGISVVILAMFLDRITAALGNQVSPIGRRALAKMRQSMHGINLIRYRPRPVVAGVGVVILALIAGGMGIANNTGNDEGSGQQASNVGHGKKVKLGYFSWPESVATTYLWKAMLDKRGYEAEATNYDVGAMFTGLSRGDIDLTTDAWLPTTHESYMKKYGKNLKDLGSWYKETSLEVAVPKYVKGVKSMKDLKGKSDKFDGKIIGIEPGAGEMKALKDGKDSVLKQYGLDKEYEVTSGSTASMLSELERDYKKKKPVAVVLWSPHWAYSKYDLNKLKDPKGAWGKQDSLNAVANKKTPKKLPQVSKWMKDFQMSPSKLANLENEIQEAGKGNEEEGAKNWLEKNPGATKKFAPLPTGKVDVGKGKEINIANFSWPESVATSYLWQEVLDRRGYKAKNKNYDVGALFTGLSRGDIDVTTDAWLPTTHESYMKKYGKNYKDLGSWYKETSLEVAVPKYVKGVKSMKDLKGKSKKFNGKIIGIEPGAGEMKALEGKGGKDGVLKKYGLDKEYDVTSGSTASMLAELERDYKQKKPVAVVLWSPHWAYSKYDLNKLKDPKGAWGKQDSIHSVANKKLPKKAPKVTKWMKNFHMKPDELANLENEVQEAGKGNERQGVKNWLKKNPGKVDEMAPVPESMKKAAASSGAAGSKKERSQPVNIGYFPWDEDVAVTHLWKNVLKNKGFKPKTKQYDVGALFTGMSQGDIDVQFDGWLPVTQKSYWNRYKKDLVKQGTWYDKTSIEVAVPKYVKGVHSLKDLKGKSDKFDGKIIGIEAGADVMQTLENDVLPKYGLDEEYDLTSSSTGSMLAELERDYKKKKPVAVLLWTPHWAYGKYDMTKLKDPKHSFGKGDHLTNLAHKSFPKKFPTLSKWFKNFHMSEKDLASLELAIKKAGQGNEDKATRAWMDKHPDTVRKMTST